MVAVQTGLVAGTTWAQQADAEPRAGSADTGTDPRDFAPKFMPYYRFTELENGLEQKDFVMFGLVPLTPKVALTYEVPVAQERDITNVSGPLPEGDKTRTGVGDSNIRILAKTGNWAGGDWLAGVQFDLPTATKDELASNQLNVGPMVTYIRDLKFWPGPGAFFALMNFYFFDVFDNSDPLDPSKNSPDVSMYVGRWFFMLPLTNPDLGLLGGIYLLPEMQPIYDFETDDFSFWIGPEIGKMLAPGHIIYAKPGWGIDNSEGADRKFTFELGYRLFL